MTENAGAKVFDRAVLYERLANDEELMREMLALFLEEAPANLDSLRHSLAEGDAPVSCRHAHSLSGAAANVAAEALRVAAENAEKAASDGDLPRVGGLVGEIEVEFERLRAELEAAGLV